MLDLLRLSRELVILSKEVERLAAGTTAPVEDICGGDHWNTAVPSSYCLCGEGKKPPLITPAEPVSGLISESEPEIRYYLRGVESPSLSLSLTCIKGIKCSNAAKENNQWIMKHNLNESTSGGTFILQESVIA